MHPDASAPPLPSDDEPLAERREVPLPPSSQANGRTGPRVHHHALRHPVVALARRLKRRWIRHADNRRAGRTAIARDTPGTTNGFVRDSMFPQGMEDGRTAAVISHRPGGVVPPSQTERQPANEQASALNKDVRVEGNGLARLRLIFAA